MSSLRMSNLVFHLTTSIESDLIPCLDHPDYEYDHAHVCYGTRKPLCGRAQCVVRAQNPQPAPVIPIRRATTVVEVCIVGALLSLIRPEVSAAAAAAAIRISQNRHPWVRPH